jgi:hypothetical protein
MRLIIEARLADGDNDMVEHGESVLAVVDGPDCPDNSCTSCLTMER